jgi:hypothetical protein
MDFIKNKEQQKKTFPGSGIWVEKPRRSEVLVCPTCKGKYIKTRPKQEMCVRCMMHAMGSRRQ